MMLRISICCVLFLIGLCSSEIRDRRSYLLISSEEIDSSEFGGPPGVKDTTCKCGWRNKEQIKIVGGKKTQENEYPFIAALIDKYTNFRLCGVTLITPYHTVTAAHCTWERRVEGDPMSVVIGEYDSTKDSSIKQVIDVKRIIEHPKFHRKSLFNDIAVLVLERMVEFNKFVGPACLPTSRVNLDNKYVHIMGWGATKQGGDGSNVLKKVDVRVVPLQTCSYNYPGKINPAQQLHICTYGRDRGSCQGDSGGPVVWVDPESNRYTLIGVVSFAAGCATSKPTVNTDVFGFMDWIEKTVKETAPRDQTCKKIA
uniref:Venom S1 protease 13 n=1 Tax=Lethocerus distinctifemur TaxID=280095 RepID=A0A2K8JR37_9HEMI|nr:venom S1 protease 13 [Lethocerus distinctifemur]